MREQWRARENKREQERAIEAREGVSKGEQEQAREMSLMLVIDSKFEQKRAKYIIIKKRG